MSNLNRTKVRRESTSTMPSALPLGEVAFNSETSELYVGTGTGKIKVNNNDLVKLHGLLDNKANSLDLETLRTRIENIISNNNPTEGNSELVDMRVDSKGVTHTSSGEHLRYLEKTSSLLHKMGTCRYETNDKINNTCVMTNEDNHLYSFRVTHTVIPNYSYNLIQFKDKAEVLRKGVKKFKLVLQSYQSFNLIVALNDRVNWSNGLMCANTVSLEPGKHHYVDIDLNTPKVKEYLDNTANNSGDLYLFLIYRGQGADAVIGEYNINAYLMSVAEDNQPQSFSEVSANSLTSDYALLAENSNMAENAKLSEKALHSNEAEHSLTSDFAEETKYAKDSFNSLNAGMKVIPPDYCTAMNSIATLDYIGDTTYRLTKLSGVGSGTIYGIHIYIPYNSLEELKNRFYMNPKLISGKGLTECFIVSNKGDWNPRNNPIRIDASNPVTLYDAINNCSNLDYRDHYLNANFLYIVYAFHSSDTSIITERETILEITPYLEMNDCKVLATHIRPEVSNLIIEESVQQSTQITKELISEIAYSYNPNERIEWSTVSPDGWVEQNVTKVGNSYVIHAEHNARSSHCCKFHTGIKQDGTIKDVTILYKSNTPNGFISVGQGFNWGLMNTLDIAPTEGSDYHMATISASKVELTMPIQVMFGTRNGTTIDMDIIYIVNYEEPRTLVTDFALSSGNSVHAINSEYSEQAKNSEHAETSNISETSLKAITSSCTLNWIANNHNLNSNKIIGATSYGKDSIHFDALSGDCEVTIEKGNEIWAYVNGVALGSREFLQGKQLVVYIQDIPSDEDQSSLNVFNISSSQTSWGNATSIYNQIKIGQINIIDLDPIINNPKFDSASTLYYVQGAQRGNNQSSPEESLATTSLHYKYKVGLINPNELSMVFADSLKGFNADDYCTKTELEEVLEDLNTGEKYITCWGDSLTAMGGWTQKLSQLTGLPVYNGGTGGESSKTIMARQGGDVMLVNNITIPSDTSPVTIATRSEDKGISTYFGHKVTPLLQGGGHMNPCTIGDVEGTLRWTGSSHSDTTGVWTFTRNKEGEEVVITRPTALVTNYDRTRNKPKIMIIFIGQNGGWDNINHLIQQHRLMIEHSQCNDFIVLGLSSGTANSRREYEEAMKNEFGRRFFSLRAYLSQYGLEDLEIEPTEQDLAMMAQGQTPQSLLIDSVHYTNECRALIGELVYKLIKELHML